MTTLQRTLLQRGIRRSSLLGAGLLVSALAAGVVLTARATEADPFVVELATPPALGAGAEATVVVTVRARGGYKVNAEYPYRAKLQGTGALVVVKEQLTRGDFQFEKQSAKANFRVRATGADGGRVRLELALSVCTETRCVVDRRSVEKVIAGKR